MTKEEKIGELKKKAKKILQQAKQLETKDKAEKRKLRASMLVKIGALLTTGVEDKEAIFEFLQKDKDFVSKITKHFAKVIDGVEL